MMQCMTLFPLKEDAPAVHAAIALWHLRDNLLGFKKPITEKEIQTAPNSSGEKETKSNHLETTTKDECQLRTDNQITNHRLLQQLEL